MRVAIVTSREELYHQHLCVEIARRHEVVAVLHPRAREFSRRESRQMRQDNLRKFGYVHHLLQRLARNRYFTLGWDEQADLQQAQQRFFPGVEADYQRHVAPLARDVDDVNSPDGIALLRSFRPDVVVCSGGPIYRAPLIEAVQLMLNFHTGISPLYNGSSTIYWTFANRQPQLTGGTLMTMSAVVDGGDILAHYLPEVEADDTPAAQFMKCLIGGTRLYCEFLDHLAQGKPFVGVRQGRPLFNYYGSDWTVAQNLAIARSIDKRICARHVRPEIVRRYWHHESRDSATSAVRQTLMELIYHG
jgi:folate-dependent phosphoribosylglycinamide formyltransferase PurN